MRVLLILCFSLVTAVSQAQTPPDTIRAGQLQLKWLPQGQQQYLVYITGKDGAKKSIWLWERTVSREQFHGSPAIVVRQQWTTSDTGFNSRTIFSACNAADFTPLYHTTVNPKTGRDAFNFLPGEIKTADTVADVIRKDFRISITEPAFNWELDLETFPLLPLKEGKSFAINFYHPGSKQAPGWYIYTVTGTEKITTLEGREIDCYKLYTAYENNRGNSTWWISRKTHEVVKMEEHFGSITRYKLRIGVLP